MAVSRYGNTANLIALAQRKIRAHVADLRSKLRNPRSEGIYSPQRFVYQPKADCYKCPAGRILSRHHFVPSRGYYEYRTKRGTCAGCRLRQFYTRDKSGRTLKRYAGQELLDKARKQCHSPQAHSDRRRRQWFQERNFAEPVVQHGFKRPRWRGLWRQSIQDYLIAAIQNFRIIARRQKNFLFVLGRKLPGLDPSDGSIEPHLSVSLLLGCQFAFPNREVFSKPARPARAFAGARRVRRARAKPFRRSAEGNSGLPRLPVDAWFPFHIISFLLRQAGSRCLHPIPWQL